MIWLLTNPFPPLPSASCLPVCHWSSLLTSGWGGEKPNLMTARKPGHLQIIQFFLVPLLVKRNCLTYVKLNNTIGGRLGNNVSGKIQINKYTDQVYVTEPRIGALTLRPVTKGTKQNLLIFTVQNQYYCTCGPC
jgi:hypothetical protein